MCLSVYVFVYVFVYVHVWVDFEGMAIFVHM